MLVEQVDLSSFFMTDSHKHKDKHKDKEHRHKDHKKDKEREKFKHNNRWALSSFLSF